MLENMGISRWDDSRNCLASKVFKIDIQKQR